MHLNSKLYNHLYSHTVKKKQHFKTLNLNNTEETRKACTSFDANNSTDWKRKCLEDFTPHWMPHCSIDWLQLTCVLFCTNRKCVRVHNKKIWSPIQAFCAVLAFDIGHSAVNTAGEAFFSALQLCRNIICISHIVELIRILLIAY